jgi:uncharacterized protein YjbI with pentapeptide repeats
VIGTVVVVDRDVDTSELQAAVKAEHVVLVRCTIRDSGFRPNGDVLAVECAFVRADMYWGSLLDSAFVACRFESSDLRAGFTDTHFHTCEFTDCEIGPDAFGRDPDFCDVHFERCEFVRTAVPRVTRRDPRGESIEGAHHPKVDARGRIGPVTFGRTSKSSELQVGSQSWTNGHMQRDSGRAVIVGCEIVDAIVARITKPLVAVDCRWRNVVFPDESSVHGVFVSCDFENVDLSGPFTCTRFVNCTFRGCRFDEALDAEPWLPHQYDFDVRFDDCVFVRCEPPTLR